ncbi:hypothetical protein Fcan01_01449 [Folsomia candida]|uniref:Uncharacterized protein n=1 Tax=Folsomia candida TaxID=158441 RepID=A0A226EWR7_FOLCA|nr:hypothetical protein Fcan01_01449 [Folsomia candida]
MTNLLRLAIWILLLVLVILELCHSSPPLPLGTKRAGQGAATPAKKRKLTPAAAKILDKYKNAAAFRTTFDKEKVNNMDATIKADAQESLNAALGHGGRYDVLQAVVSRDELIESDHAPHYSIMEYLENVKDLPTPLKTDIDERLRLKKELGESEFGKNSDKVKQLETEIENLNKEIFGAKPPPKLNKKDWPKSIKQEYDDTISKIKKLLKEKKDVKDQLKTLKSCREKAVKDVIDKLDPAKKPDPIKLAQLENKQNEVVHLTSINAELSRGLEEFNDKLKGKMGVLSIPYEKHRLFPSTGGIGIPDAIKELKGGSVADAKTRMDEFRNDWRQEMQNGLKLKEHRFTGVDPDFEKGKPTEAQREAYHRHLWEVNFPTIYETWSENKVIPTKGRTPTQHVLANHQELRRRYARYWMSKVIYSLKAKDFKGMISLFISEYKLYLGEYFNNFKSGLQKLLKTNEGIGWLKNSEIDDLVKSHGLDEQMSSLPGWDKVESLIVAKEDTKVAGKRKQNPPVVQLNKLTIACTASTRTVRAASLSEHNCILLVKNKGHDESVKVEKKEEESIFPKPQVIEENQQIVSIDSRKLSKYLESFRDELDFESVKEKETVVEVVCKNQDKLIGDEESIRRVKAMIKQEILEIHNNQNSLSKSITHITDQIDPKSMSNYDRVRVSSSRFARRASKFTSSTGEFGGVYGKVMLAKGVVSALRHGDYTSLEIMGGRMGLDGGLQAVENAGSVLVKKVGTKLAVKIGSKMSSIIAKVTGPIGAVVDIGISIYSLTSSVKALNNPNATKYEQNDAIADIVADSIDIAVAATAAILSIAFPPLAPVFSAVALIVNILTTIFVSVYKAANHVNQLNDEIPLLDYEKVDEALRYMSGADTSIYLEDLIKTKNLNNIVVNMTVLWLKENPDFIGKVFPSQTLLNPEGDCYLQERKHTYVMGVRVNSWNWQRWSCGKGPRNVCQEGFYCRYKSNDLRVLGSGTLQEYFCECAPEPGYSFDGYDVLDNLVDFRSKQYIFLERWAPDHLLPSDFSYSCKPGSLSFQGDRLSRRDFSKGFLCEGAIGVERSNGEGKYMLYDLKRGKDAIFLDEGDKRDSLFLVGDGVKTFEGGGGDTFMLDGPCSSVEGKLDGGGSKDVGNSLILSSNCTAGNPITVHLPRQKVTLSSGNLGVFNVERIIGRTDQVEIIYAACTTKLIAGQGGRNSGGEEDQIIIPHCSKGQLDLAILIHGYTFVEFASFSEGKVVILLNEGTPYLKAHIPTYLKDAEIVLKVENVGGLKDIEISGKKDNKTILLHLGHGDIESSKTQALFWLGSSSPPDVRHVTGLAFTGNLFYLSDGQNWVITGTEKDNDIFYLQNTSFSGTIFGGGGRNTLILTKELDPTATLYIGKGQVTGGVTFEHIDSIVGRENDVEEITTFCELRHLSLNGGSDISHPDKIIIKRNPECVYDLTVFVRGSTFIKYEMDRGQLFIQMGPELGEANFTSNLKLDLTRRSIGTIVMLVNYNIEEISSIYSTPLSHSIVIAGSQIDVTGRFLDNDSINFPIGENTVQTVMVQTIDSDLIAFHLLPTSPLNPPPRPRLVKGIPFVENRFRIQKGNWNVVMSPLSETEQDKDDIFVIEDSEIFGSIDGAMGTNTITFSEKISGLVKISENGTISLASRGKISTRNVQVWQGRAGGVEQVRVDLDLHSFKVISLNGGSESDPDEIIITNNATVKPYPHNLTIIATGNTRTHFFETGPGNFEIYVHTSPSNLTKFSGDFSLTNETKFSIPIKIPPHKVLDSKVKVGQDAVEIELDLGRGNFIKFSVHLGNISDSQISPIFVSDAYKPEANLLLNLKTAEVLLLHAFEDESQTIANKEKWGAIGIKNIHRVGDSFRIVHGGKYDDSFILENSRYSGQINGYGGINSLILDDRINSTLVTINLAKETLTFDQDVASVKGIQIVNGRKQKSELVVTDCYTKLVRLEGGFSLENPDVIQIPKNFCTPNITIVTNNFTKVENHAERGNFTYVVNDLESFDVVYVLGSNNITHNFKLNIDLEQQVNSVSFSGNNFVMQQSNFVPKLFRLILNNGSENAIPPNFQLISDGDGKLFADLSFNLQVTNGTIDTSVSLISATIIAKPFFSGNITSLNGATNDLLIETEEKVGKIFGGDLDDNIFLIESTLLIDEIDGKGGTNLLQLMPGFWPGYDLEIDLRINSSSLNILHKDDEEESYSLQVVKSIKNVKMFAGRDSSFEKIFVACDTMSVANADLIVVSDPDCNYNLWVTIGNGTRVSFQIDDGQLPSNNAGYNDTGYNSDLINGHIDDGHKPEVKNLRSSIFYYNFIEPCTFDIEIDSFSRLANTRHIFNLKFNLSDIKSISISDQNETITRLVYTLHSSGLEYSHILSDFDETEMFYSKPEFMTEDGFQILITKYSEIIFSFGNLEEILSSDVIRATFIPTISQLATNLGVSFIIETARDFVYSGNPMELSTLTNRENVTSHLVGFNGTTYVIFTGLGDVHIYPQMLPGSNHSNQVIDLTDIISQIKNKTGISNYVPSIAQVENSSDLKIEFPGHSNIFPNRVIIVNGTTLRAGDVQIILRTMPMHISFTNVEGNNDPVWGLVPQVVKIPHGHVYQFDPQDFEHGTEVHDEHPNIGVNYTCAKDGDDLIVTSIPALYDVEHHFIPTSFIISNYYEYRSNSSNSNIEGSHRVHIKLGTSKVSICGLKTLLASGGGTSTQRGMRPVVSSYQDILRREEDKILIEFPDIPRFFNSSLV